MVRALRRLLLGLPVDALAGRSGRGGGRSGMVEGQDASQEGEGVHDNERLYLVSRVRRM